MEHKVYYRINSKDFEFSKVKTKLDEECLSSWFDICSDNFNVLTYFDAERDCYYIAERDLALPVLSDKVRKEIKKELIRVEEYKKHVYIRHTSESHVIGGAEVCSVYCIIGEKYKGFAIRNKSNWIYYFMPGKINHEDCMVIQQFPTSSTCDTQVVMMNDFNEYLGITEKDSKKDIYKKVLEHFSKHNCCPVNFFHGKDYKYTQLWYNNRFNDFLKLSKDKPATRRFPNVDA